MLQQQEAFDTIVNHIVAQGQKSHSGGICLYRGNNGLKCAAGCLIPDEKYRPEIEGKSISALAATCDDVFPPMSDDTFDCVESLQRTHDRARNQCFLSDFLRQAKLYAKNAGLDTASVDLALVELK